MKKLEKALDVAMSTITSVVMLVLLIFGTWQIFTRWILNDPSTFTEELLRYLLIWAGMIGAAYCFFHDKRNAAESAGRGGRYYRTGFCNICVYLWRCTDGSRKYGAADCGHAASDEPDIRMPSGFGGVCGACQNPEISFHVFGKRE